MNVILLGLDENNRFFDSVLSCHFMKGPRFRDDNNRARCEISRNFKPVQTNIVSRYNDDTYMLLR